MPLVNGIQHETGPGHKPIFLDQRYHFQQAANKNLCIHSWKISLQKKKNPSVELY